jgi:hypothetical protein
MFLNENTPNSEAFVNFHNTENFKIKACNPTPNPQDGEPQVLGNRLPREICETNKDDGCDITALADTAIGLHVACSLVRISLASLTFPAYVT